MCSNVRFTHTYRPCMCQWRGRLAGQSGGLQAARGSGRSAARSMPDGRWLGHNLHVARYLHVYPGKHMGWMGDPRDGARIQTVIQGWHWMYHRMCVCTSPLHVYDDRQDSPCPYPRSCFRSIRWRNPLFVSDPSAPFPSKRSFLDLSISRRLWHSLLEAWARQRSRT